MDIDEAVPLIFSQTLRPSNLNRTIMLCDFIDELINNIPIYKLKCNMDVEAAEVAFNAMSKSLGKLQRAPKNWNYKSVLEGLN